MAETNGAHWQDPDTARVIDILKGAQRAPTDPDIDIALAIAKLAEDEDLAAYDTILEQLTSDARSD